MCLSTEVRNPYQVVPANDRWVDPKKKNTVFNMKVKGNTEFLEK